MQSKILTSCLVAGVLLAAGAVSRAQETNATPNANPSTNAAPRPMMRPLPGARPGSPMAVLSEEQRTSFNKNMADKKAEMMELTSKLRTAQQEVNEAMIPFNENLIREKVMEQAKLQADLYILQAKAFADVLPPLTADQIQTIKDSQAPRPMVRPMQTPPTAPPTPGTNHDTNGQPPKQ